MCPDRQIISLYLDKELPSPWNEKMAAHLESCSHCQVILAGYRNLGATLERPHYEAIQTAQDRVWKKITAPRLIIGQAGGRPLYGRFSGRRVARESLVAARKLVRRRVTLPLPAAVAAMVIVAFAAFFSLSEAGGASQPMPLPQHPAVQASVNIGFDDYAPIPIHDMSDVIRYLSIPNDADFMIIRLPEHRNFSRTGQPTLINAADYSVARRNFHR